MIIASSRRIRAGPGFEIHSDAEFRESANPAQASGMRDVEAIELGQDEVFR